MTAPTDGLPGSELRQPDPQERAARFALAHVVEPGDPRLTAEVEHLGAVEVWHRLRTDGGSDKWSARAAAFDPGAAHARTNSCGSRFVVPGDEEWPTGFADLVGCEPVQQRTGAPFGLWVRGRAGLATTVGTGLAMVGARAATAYGEHVALELAHDLADAGIPVVSGAAYGIDAASHRGALTAPASRTVPVTVAVLACGIDQAYPASHADLLAAVEARGSVVSEIAPGQHPTRLRFLSRNRLIAAMTRATLIVEAGYRSGARNTVTWATVCGRPVMAVPGPVTSALSVTPNRLLRDHEAELVSSLDDVRALLAPAGEHLLAGHEEPASVVDLLDEPTRTVLEALPGRGVVGLEELSLRAALPLPRCAAELETLAAQGLVQETLTGEWQLTHRHLARRA